MRKAKFESSTMALSTNSLTDALLSRQGSLQSDVVVQCSHLHHGRQFRIEQFAGG